MVFLISQHYLVGLLAVEIMAQGVCGVLYDALLVSLMSICMYVPTVIPIILLN